MLLLSFFFLTFDYASQVYEGLFFNSWILPNAKPAQHSKLYILNAIFSVSNCTSCAASGGHLHKVTITFSRTSKLQVNHNSSYKENIIEASIKLSKHI